MSCGQTCGNYEWTFLQNKNKRLTKINKQIYDRTNLQDPPRDSDVLPLDCLPPNCTIVKYSPGLKDNVNINVVIICHKDVSP